MTSLSPQPKHSTFKGTLYNFLGEALLLPTGLATAIFLSRSLQPEGYGLFTLAATIVTWLEWCTTSMFARTTIKFVSQAVDWRPVATTVLQQHLLVSSIVTLTLCLFALPIAQLMHEPTLTVYLLLFSLEIPLFALAKAHRYILTGLGRFSEQAIASGSRWVARLIFIVLLVNLGFSLSGAILGSVAASFVELAFSRFYIRPQLWHRSSFPIKQLWNYAIPLTLYTLTMRFFDKLDVFMLKALGGSAQQVGIYGAAQNLTIIPGLFALSFTPVLLSNINRMLYEGNVNEAKKLSQQAIRLVLLILPFASMTAGAAPSIVKLIFGEQYLPSASILAVLIFGAVAQVMISVNTTILIAAGKPNWTFAIGAPLLPLAFISHWFLIPRMGEEGAATVTTLAASLGACATVLAVYRVWKILPPHSSMKRTIINSGLTYVLAAFLPSPGFWLLMKLAAITLTIPLTFLMLGEFTNSEINNLIFLIRSAINYKQNHSKP